MRYLKNKIQKAQDALRKRELENATLPQNFNNSQNVYSSRPELNEKLKEFEPKIKEEYVSYITKKEEFGTKDMTVNYANAIRVFASSTLATPHLQAKLDNEAITQEEFATLIKKKCPFSFRARLLVDEKDDVKTAACKKVFQWIAEVFLKYFSANWIINEKMPHKKVYLRFRFKMLRRVRNPEAFAYIKQKSN